MAALAEGNACLLPAKYGLLPPGNVDRPYDLTAGQPGAVTADEVRAQARDLGIASRAVAALFSAPVRPAVPRGVGRRRRVAGRAAHRPATVRPRRNLPHMPPCRHHPPGYGQLPGRNRRHHQTRPERDMPGYRIKYQIQQYRPGRPGAHQRNEEAVPRSSEWSVTNWRRPWRGPHVPACSPGCPSAGRDAPAGGSRAHALYLRLRSLRPGHGPCTHRRGGGGPGIGPPAGRDRPVAACPGHRRDHQRQRATVKCGSATFTLVLLPEEEYPALRGMPPLAGSVGSDALATAISQVAIAAGRDDSLPALTGIRIEIQGNAVAAGRHRQVPARRP